MKKRGAIVIYTAHKGCRLRLNASCSTVGRDYLVVFHALHINSVP